MNKQEQTCLQCSATVVRQYGRTIDIYIVVTLVIVVTVVTVMTVVTVDGNKHVRLQDLAPVCISNKHYLGFGGLWVCTKPALV